MHHIVDIQCIIEHHFCVKTNRQHLINQRKLMDRKLSQWLPLRPDQAPRIGWIKAVRGALGLNTRQLARRLGVDQSSVSRLEEREPAGKVTLELLGRAARAMNCRLIYAVVPDIGFDDLDAIVSARARRLAEQLVRRTEHSMRLERQGTGDALLEAEIQELAGQLKSKLDPRIWSEGFTDVPIEKTE